MDSGNPKDVKLDRMMIAPTNGSADDHNDSAFNKFPGDRKYKLLAVTQITPKEFGPEAAKKKYRVPIFITPEITFGLPPTGFTPYFLEITIAAPVIVIRNVLFRPFSMKGVYCEIFVRKSDIR